MAALSFPAHAQPTARYALSLERGEGAGACPDEVAFAAEVSRRQGHDVFGPSGERRVHVVLTRSEASWRADVTIEAPGSPSATTHFETTGNDCRPLFDAAAFAVSVVIDGDAKKEAEPAAELAEPPLRERPSTAATTPPSRSAAPKSDHSASRDEPSRARADRRANWVSLEIAEDLVFMPSASGVCSPAAQVGRSFECVSGSERYIGVPHPDYAGNVEGGVRPGTHRLLVGYERALTHGLGALVRGGFAFGDTPAGFFPFHVEVDARYRFGENAYAGHGIRGYVSAGIGLADFVARVDATISDCTNTPCPRGSPPTAGAVKQVAVYRHDGDAFVSIAVGVLWVMESGFGPFAELAASSAFPAEGFALEPSVGLAAGF